MLKKQLRRDFFSARMPLAFTISFWYVLGIGLNIIHSDTGLLCWAPCFQLDLKNPYVQLGKEKGYNFYVAEKNLS